MGAATQEATHSSRKRASDDTCPHSIRLPVVEIQTVCTRGDCHKKTTNESVHGVKCWRQEDQSSSEDVTGVFRDFGDCDK